MLPAFPTLLLLLLSTLSTLSTLAQPPLPHILFVLVDDWGWSDVGYHRKETNTSSPEIVTPTIDTLVSNGVEFNRHYVHMTCTPSRASFQTGRLPIHTLTKLAGPCDKNGAIPRNMTGLAQQLKKAGYHTHQVGKWDCGMATPKHTPKGRGYDTSLNYFGHGNWMFSEVEWGGSEKHRNEFPTDPSIVPKGIVDFWDTDQPAHHLNGTGYEEYIFRDRIQLILKNYNHTRTNNPSGTGPLFLNYDSKIAHYPLQAPLEYQEKFSFIQENNRKMYHAMIHFLDDQLANITDSFKEYGLWDNTLMIVSSDNGGYVKNPLGGCNTTSGTKGGDQEDVGHGTTCFNGEAGANNWPLRGGKYSSFEGGIRVNAFASGGYLPTAVRGTKLEGIIHVADWYGTLCNLAGVSFHDAEAESSGLPKVDSLDMWPMLSGLNLTSPRETILVNENLLLHNQWKYVPGNTKMIESAYGGSVYPNATTDRTGDSIDTHQLMCPPQGCLFNVVNDMEERHEISHQYPKVVEMMKDLLMRERTTIWKTNHVNDPECPIVAERKYGNFYGPWLEI